MSRFLSSLMAAAFVVSLAAVAGATAKSHGHMMSHPMSMSKCASGKKWVHGYTKKDGAKVKRVLPLIC